MGAEDIAADLDMPPHVRIDIEAASFVKDAADEQHAQHSGEGGGPLEELEPSEGIGGGWRIGASGGRSGLLVRDGDWLGRDRGLDSAQSYILFAHTE